MGRQPSWPMLGALCLASAVEGGGRRAVPELSGSRVWPTLRKACESCEYEVADSHHMGSAAQGKQVVAMLEQLQAQAQESVLLEALEDLELRAEPSGDAPELGCLEQGCVVKVRGLRNGWARLHEDELWATGRAGHVPLRCFRKVSEWPFEEAVSCAEANQVPWRRISGGLRPKQLEDLAWLSAWHCPDGTLLEAPPLRHEDHRAELVPRLCVASMVREVPPKLLESLILQHHANGIQQVGQLLAWISARFPGAALL